MIDLAAANWNTAARRRVLPGLCARPRCSTNHTFKSPRLRRLHELEHETRSDVGRIV